MTAPRPTRWAATRAAKTAAATAGMVACLGVAALLGVMAWRTLTPVPRTPEGGGAVTFTADRGDDVFLSRHWRGDDGPDTARCTVTPAGGGQAREVTVGRGDDDGPGLALEAWWDGRAELRCDWPVSGRTGPTIAFFIVPLGAAGAIAALFGAGSFAVRATRALRA